MGENKNTTNNPIDSTNIFEDFTSDKGLGEEVKKQEQKESKDVFHYLRIFTNVLKIGNLLLILCLGLFFLYNFFQSKENSENYQFLSPICQFILGDTAENTSGCYGVTSFLNTTQAELDKHKMEQFSTIQPLFEHVYALDNFTNSKSVTFLLNKSQDRLRPLTILSEFDALKNKFEPIDKSKITCYDLVVREDMTFDARCEAYSSDWDSDITTTNQKKSSGTSISVASSFIEFLENTPGSNFKIMNKQKIFQHSNISGNGIYTKRTQFDLNMKYIDSNNLSL